MPSIVLGLWGLYILIKERVAGLRLRDYIPTINAIAVGFGLIGLAQSLRLLLVIFRDALRPDLTRHNVEVKVREDFKGPRRRHA